MNGQPGEEGVIRDRGAVIGHLTDITQYHITAVPIKDVLTTVTNAMIVT